MKTQSAKAKGRRLQQHVRDMILLNYSQLDYDDVRSTGMGQGGEDVQLSPLARSIFPYSVECKSLKSFSIYKYLEQCENNCPEGVEPLLVIKGDRKKPLAIIDLEHFFDLVGY